MRKLFRLSTPAPTLADDRELEARRDRRVATGDAFAARGHEEYAKAMAVIARRPPLSDEELRAARTHNAEAPEMADAELVAIALEASDLDSGALAATIGAARGDVGRWWADPDGVPIGHRLSLAGVLEARAPDYAPLAGELRARAHRRLQAATSRAAAGIVDRLTPDQVDAWGTAWSQAALSDDGPITRALMSAPPDEAERILAGFGRELADAIVSADRRA